MGIRVPGGTIRQAWLRHRKTERTLRFLLLLSDTPIISTSCSKCAAASRLYLGNKANDVSSHGHTIKRLVTELLLPKLESLVHEWESYDISDSAQISTDIMRCTVSACVSSCLILALIEDVSSSKIDSIGRILERLVTLITTLKLEGDESRMVMEAMLHAIQPYLPAPRSAEIQHMYQTCNRLANIFTSFGDAFKNHKSQKYDISTIDDLMELDTLFDTQQSWTRSERAKNMIERREMEMNLSPAAFFNGTSTKLMLISSFSESQPDTNNIPSQFTDYLVGLSPMELVSSTEIITEILQGDLAVAPGDAVRLLHCTEALLTPQYSCCEVTLGLCIDTLTGLLPTWAETGGGDLADMALELYTWLVDTVFLKRRPSPNVQIRLSNLLYELIRIQPTYGEAQSLPSVRTCLFDILQKAPIPVKFHIGERVPGIFGLFVLKNHLEILNDLLQSLPMDPDWCEGNAFRLYILSKLASRWPTLLRSCAYYILEVSGRVPISIPYAKRCLSQVSQALGLGNGRELFQLFNSQFLFTWLRTEPFESLPYSIFGYNSLTELLQDSQEEICALMVMRDRDIDVDRLADLLGEPIEQLLTRSFPKVIAYSIAHDVSIPPDTSI
jgi:ataxia telangiectasia mutated family protein